MVWFPADDRIFDGFGPSWLAGGAEPAFAEAALTAEMSASRKLVRHQCPAAPGVYGMIDAEGRLIYVGKSKCLRDRLLSYFTGKAMDKARRIIGHAGRLRWEVAPHEFTALVRELELIRRWSPRFNVKGRTGRLRRGYIAIGRAPGAYVYVTDRPSRRDQYLYGPLAPNRDLHGLVHLLNDYFQLRDCPDRVPMRFADQRELFSEEHAAQCMRHAMGTCLGPCCSACTQRQYGDRVRAAREFLSGASLRPLQVLERAMRKAAAAERFERAAALRDLWSELTRLGDLLERMRTVQRSYSFLYPLPGYLGREMWYMVRHGQVVGGVSAPRGRRQAGECLAALEVVFPSGPENAQEVAVEDHDMLLVVSSWFRLHPEELDRTLSPEQARDRCRVKSNSASMQRPMATLCTTNRES